MGLLNRIFGKGDEKQCPRCLGKGHVDMADIKRLKMELSWLPGKCAYCNGAGNISSSFEKNVEVDCSYLTIDIGPDERSRLFKGEPAALQRAAEHEQLIKNYVAQIWYLYSIGNLSANQIADFFLFSYLPGELTQPSRDELVGYINTVILEKTTKN
jgi:hypothetical protein